jgi:hypothetical protein
MAKAFMPMNRNNLPAQVGPLFWAKAFQSEVSHFWGRFLAKAF